MELAVSSGDVRPSERFGSRVGWGLGFNFYSINGAEQGGLVGDIKLQNSGDFKFCLVVGLWTVEDVAAKRWRDRMMSAIV